MDCDEPHLAPNEWKNAAHPVDRTANWCIGGCWFTLAALFHIGSTKSHPPIPEHLSHQGKDFLLKCPQRESTLRPSATELLKHPFVLTCEIQGGLDGSEDIQQQAPAADGHLQQQQANMGNTELRSVKGTWRQVGQNNWKPTGCLGRVHPFLSEAPHTQWRILITSTGLPEGLGIQTWTTLIVLWGWTL